MEMNIHKLRSIKLRKKIKLEKSPTEWVHHRGNWPYALKTLQDTLHTPDGILFVSAADELITNGKMIDEPWIGFIHHIPKNNRIFHPDLERLLKNDLFLKSLEKCRGIFVLSCVLKRYLLESLSRKVPVVQVLHPIVPFPEEKKFSWENFDKVKQKQVFFIGEFLRNFQAFFELKVPQGYQKCLLKVAHTNLEQLYDLDKKRVVLPESNSVVIKSAVPDDEYDNILSRSIVFLNLYDAAANNTIVECLGRNTPLVINRLPGVEEYLGSQYPLFYETLDEAATILQDRKRLENGTEYLKSHPTASKLSGQCFVDAIVNSSVYRSLPLPLSQRQDSQQTKFPQFDLTVVICSYKRVYNLQRLLDCFTQQDYVGTFELILWNNNKETQAEVARIAEPYKERLNIRLIQSSENYYCIIRLAVARLMHSDILLVCDDDNVPHPTYISKFMTKYKQHGPRVVLCCRGNVFGHHVLNEEEPHRFWKECEDRCVRFYSEEAAERQVHFFHACNCLIPRSLLLEVSGYDLPSPDFILVDDYWMSFVLSHHLKVPLIKIQGHDIFTRTPCAEDPSIALYLNKDVQEQQVNFYVYHMMQGWPASIPLDF